MSRPRKPTALKALQGTTRKDRTNPAEPKPKLAGIACPYPLNEKAIPIWDELAAELSQTRVLTEADLQGLKMLCESIAQYDSLYKRLWEKQANGEMEYTPIQKFYEIWDGKGKNKRKLPIPVLIRTAVKPEVALIAEGRKFQKGMLEQFGLTPASRQKVNAEPLDDKDNRSALQKLRDARVARKKAREKKGK